MDVVAEVTTDGVVATGAAFDKAQELEDLVIGEQRRPMTLAAADPRTEEALPLLARSPRHDHALDDDVLREGLGQ